MRPVGPERRLSAPAGVAVLVLLCGCLPRHAVGRGDALEADRYHVRARVEAAPIGEGAPVSWSVEGHLTVVTARSFRDGSLGRLVVFDETFPGLGGAIVEMRVFPAGAVVEVDGLGPWTGVGVHGELLDGVWLALTPRVPKGDVGEVVTDTLSWPAGSQVEPSAWMRVAATWSIESATAWSWGGPLTGSGRSISMTGTAEGRVERSEGRVVRASVHQDREVVRRHVHQRQVLDVVVEHVGTAPSPVLASPYTLDDMEADATPLRLADGREVSEGPAPAASLPFLLLDEDDAGLVARIRGTLVGLNPSESAR